ncbi:MAG: hypothetical protein M1826_001181 [Phylliscum demangeonii]|nr:MAG: hypothetical protein M1826_001181 [Phylliscum demangeonii]
MPPAPSSTAPPSSQSGIVTTTSGARHIPASRRADGSTRREIPIRPGYRPPEDVETYKNRMAAEKAAAGKTRGGVPGAALVVDDMKAAGAAAAGAGGKNAKRREARRKAKDVSVPAPAVTTTTKVAGGGGGGGGDAAADDEDEGDANDEAEPEAEADAEREKEARKIMKKLRQARELRLKKESGGNLLPEQLEKVIRIHDLVRQLDGLGVREEERNRR